MRKSRPIEKIRSVTIRGRRYSFHIYTLGKDQDGECDNPKAKGKSIAIHPRILKTPRRLMTTLIHESLHAACWDLDEEWVQETADDIERILYRAGYRLMEGDTNE